MASDRLWQARVFVAAADAASFQDAASSLNRRPSAVTAAIKALENAEGHAGPLFERQRTGSILTPEGEALLPHARRLVESADEFEARLTADTSGPLTLRVGTIQGAWFNILASAQEKLGETIRLESVALDPYWPVQPLLSGEVAYLLLPAPSDHDLQLHRIPVFTEPRTVSVSAASPLGQREKAELEEFDRGTWIGTPPGADRLFTQTHRCDDVRGGPPPNKPGPFILNPIDIGTALRADKVQIGSMRSITELFEGLIEGVADVPVADAPPWQIDLVTRQSRFARSPELTENLAATLRDAVTEAGHDTMIPVS